MVILQLEEQPRLIQAIFAGAINEVKDLAQFKEDVNALDCEGRTPLHAAAFKGEPKIAAFLLKGGARVNAKDNKWITPLHRACAVEADEVVKLLLRCRADVNARDKLWQTPLHVAAANDAYNSLQHLLRYTQNPNITDRSGRTALHHAAYNGHNYIVELLLTKGCIVNACDKKDFRPLHFAVQMGHIQVVELLIANGADINAKDRNQYTPLHVAAAAGVDSVCKILLHAGAEVEAQNSYGNTPLHIACLNGHLNICQELVSVNANLEAVNFRGQTPLHIAAASTNGVDCLMLLLRHNVDLNRQSADGRTPLHMTAIHGRFTRSKNLIDKGALIDCGDKNGCTPLHIAAQYGHDLLANTLLSYGADPARKGYEGRTPLHMCCLSGYVECCRKFVQARVDLNEKDDSGKTPTHCAAYKGSYECLDLLVSNGADFKLLDNLGRLPLHYAASQGHYQCVFTLVGIGTPVNVQDVEGCTPLHLAAAYDQDGKCIEYLLEHKADPTLTDNRGYTPLHYAIAGGNANCGALVNFLRTLKDKANDSKMALEVSQPKPLIEKEPVDITPLHLAARYGNVDILRMVLPLFDDVNVRTNQGVTPLILAAREGHAECVHVLLRFGAKVALADYVRQMTAVHYSAKNCHSQCLTLLLHNSEDQEVVNMVDSQHRTALMLAVSGNNLECVQTLLKCGADPNIADVDGHTSLFRAVANGSNNIVQLLLTNKADPNLRDVNGKIALHIAAACGNYICMRLMMERMTPEEIEAGDNQQFTALHWAAYNRQCNGVEQLLEWKNVFRKLKGNPYSPVHCAAYANCDTSLEFMMGHFGHSISNVRDSRKRTPLHIAAIHGNAAFAKYLMDFGARARVFDEDNRTPLIAAAQYGQLHSIDVLLIYGSLPTLTDKTGNTALHWACIKKYTDCALMLLDDEYPGDCGVNIANNEKKTALHIAARNGLVEVTRQLIKRGASLTVVDNEGLTPALSCAPNSHVAQCLALILGALPQFSNQNSKDDILNLAMFYRNLYCKDKRSSVCLQTDMSLLNADSHKKLPGRLIKKSFATVDFKQNLSNDDDCFIVENEDFHETTIQEELPERVGMNLHKSLSEMSIVMKQIRKPTVVYKPRQCRECFRLQHRCAECSMRILLKKHLTGKTNQKEFNEFLVRCFSETSSDYRRIFNNALEQVGRELNLSDNLKPCEFKPSGLITEQLAMLNKNRSLIGCMKRQPAGVSGKKISHEKLQPDFNKKKYKIERKFEKKEMFVIDKNDSVLKKVSLEKLENESQNGDFTDLFLRKPIKTLSQFHLATSSFGDVENAPRLCPSGNLSVQSFIVEVLDERSENLGSKYEKLNLKELSIDDKWQKDNRDSPKGSADEAKSLLNIGKLDEVKQAFSELDNMLQEIDMELEVDENVPLTKKKSKSDNQGHPNLQ